MNYLRVDDWTPELAVIVRNEIFFVRNFCLSVFELPDSGVTASLTVGVFSAVSAWGGDLFGVSAETFFVSSFALVVTGATSAVTFSSEMVSFFFSYRDIK